MEFVRRRHRDNSFSRDTRKQTEAKKRKRETGGENRSSPFSYRSSFNLDSAVSGTVESAQGRRTDPRLRSDLPRDDLDWFDLIGLLGASQASPVSSFGIIGCSCLRSKKSRAFALDRGRLTGVIGVSRVHVVPDTWFLHLCTSTVLRPLN